MATEQDYQVLVKRLADLDKKRNLLVVREEEKARIRKDLEAQLAAAGIDLTNPEAELARLNALVQEDLAKQQEAVAQFERELLVLEGNTLPIADVSETKWKTTIMNDPPLNSGSDLDLD